MLRSQVKIVILIMKVDKVGRVGKLWMSEETIEENSRRRIQFFTSIAAQIRTEQRELPLQQLIAAKHDGGGSGDATLAVFMLDQGSMDQVVYAGKFQRKIQNPD